MKAWAPNGSDVVEWPGNSVEALGLAPENWTEERRERAAEVCSRTKPWTYRKLAKGAAKAAKREGAP